MGDFDPHAYSITVQRRTVDGDLVFCGTVHEFPDITTYEKTFKRAYEGTILVIETLHETALENALPFPAPDEGEPEFSGRITLRLPITLHRSIARLAEADNTSLNTFITMTLAQAQAHSERPSVTTIGSFAVNTATIGSFAVNTASVPLWIGSMKLHRGFSTAVVASEMGDWWTDAQTEGTVIKVEQFAANLEEAERMSKPDAPISFGVLNWLKQRSPISG